eukprot:GHVS01061321.1.p2 GENE.GHVS01061321.1~~GHVS01061321.1.p2  ORF type:complete len:134 (+),score=26.80 GHVS01061321.1:1593-1994(+)
MPSHHHYTPSATSPYSCNTTSTSQYHADVYNQLAMVQSLQRAYIAAAAALPPSLSSHITGGAHMGHPPPGGTPHFVPYAFPCHVLPHHHGFSPVVPSVVMPQQQQEVRPTPALCSPPHVPLVTQTASPLRSSS